MKQVSKFIPIEGNEEQTNPENTTKANGSTFKVVNEKNNLPVKSNFWTRFKSVMLYQIKVELTPHQQKIEDEINEFLHQEITWSSFKDFFLGKSSTPLKSK